MDTKRCTFCKETKQKTDFTPHPHCKGGVMPQCRQCKNFKIKWRRIEKQAKDMALSVDDVINLSIKVEECTAQPQAKQVLTEKAKELLTKKEAQVLSLRYEGLTFKEIGVKMGYSRGRIQQIEKKAKYALSLDARHDVEFRNFENTPVPLDIWLEARGVLAPLCYKTSSYLSVIPAIRDLMSRYSATNDLIFDPVLEALIDRARNTDQNKDEWIGICEELVAFMK